MLNKFGSLTLTQRLFLLTAVALAPAFVILVYNLVTFRAAREAEFRDTALNAGHIAALELERIVYGSEDVLRAVSIAPSGTPVGPGCNAYLAALDAHLQRFATIRIIGLTGEVECTSEAEIPTVSFADRPYFLDAVEHGRFTVGTYTEDRVDRLPVLPLALPVRGPTGEIEKVVVGTLDLGWLGARLKERDFSDNRALTIADRNGVILAREPFPERFVGTRIPEAFGHLVTADAPGTEEILSQDGTRRVIGYFPVSAIPRGLYVSLGISKQEIVGVVENATLRGFVVAVAGLAVSMLFAFLTGRALVRAPLERIVHTVAAWRRGDETARTGMGEQEAELGAVGRAIDDYMDELVADRRLRRRAEQHRELLLRELDHRVKNILATIQAVARQTFREGVDTRQAMEAFSARLAAIAYAHGLLVNNAWQSADLAAVVIGATAPFRGERDDRIRIEGPDLRIRARAVLAFAMALHELCTNSVKYGALSADGGRVTVTWRVEGSRLLFVWAERDGPPVKSPERTGFGSRMIGRLFAAEVEATVDLDYRPTGVVCTVDAPLSGLTEEAPVEDLRQRVGRPAPAPESVAG